MHAADSNIDYRTRGYSNSNVNNTSLDISYSQSINTICSMPHYIASENVQAGERIQGRMSNVRRFFCLFVTFDLLLISLMWLICVVLKGVNIIDALKQQIFHYDIHKSLFDIVLVAALRFIVLILFYAIFYFNHWIFVAATTCLSCAALIGKVFLYDWLDSSQQVFEVLLILASFIISWGEAWFLDFRVVPQEQYAARYFSGADPERAPILPGHFQRNLRPSATDTAEPSLFYSPDVSSAGSQKELLNSSNLYPAYNFGKEQEDHYKEVAAKTLQCAWDLVHKTDWKEAKCQGQDIVYSRKHPKGGKMFKLVAQLDASARFILDELYFKVDELPRWNPAMKESHKVQTFDEKTDICYQISNDGAGGLVCSRDFVTLRRWALRDDCYIIASVGTEHPSLPINKKIIRGEPDVSCFLMKPLPHHPNQCQLQWVFNTNLKLSIPKFIYEPELAKTMFKYVDDLRRHLLATKTV